MHILEVAMALIFQGDIPIRFGGECILFVVYLIKRLPTDVLKGQTFFQWPQGNYRSS